MRIVYDPDEWTSEVNSRPCTMCGGDLKKCNGGCNGWTSIGQRRRPPEEIAKIKAERRRKEEDEILARAELIKFERNQRS